MLWKKIAIPAVCCLALTAGALLLQAQTSLSDMLIRFSDGTIQETAAHNCSNPADPDDEMIRVGGICIDKYEASVWNEDGTMQYGIDSDDYPCFDTGQDCDNIYARSVEGVQPSGFITWFQAQQALANSGKRLPTNAEWQMAVRGTPDSDFCNVVGASVLNTGALDNCVSDWGAHDMVGNLWEWVADWMPASTNCTGWGGFSDDLMCLSGASTTAIGPGALSRGGTFFNSTGAGPFAVRGNIQPSSTIADFGFRGAR